MDIATKCQTHNAERLIDANVLKAKVFTSSSKAMNAQAKTACINMINKAPTIDTVEVVRCKDCTYHDDFFVGAEGSLLCWKGGTDRVVSAMGYCECGERSEE